MAGNEGYEIFLNEQLLQEEFSVNSACEVPFITWICGLRRDPISSADWNAMCRLPDDPAVAHFVALESTNNSKNPQRSRAKLQRFQQRSLRIHKIPHDSKSALQTTEFTNR